MGPEVRTARCVQARVHEKVPVVRTSDGTSSLTIEARVVTTGAKVDVDVVRPLEDEDPILPVLFAHLKEVDIAHHFRVKRIELSTRSYDLNGR